MSLVTEFRSAIAADMATLLASYAEMLAAAERIDAERVAAGLGEAHTLAAFAADRIADEPDSAKNIFLRRGGLFTKSLKSLLSCHGFEGIALAEPGHQNPLTEEESARLIASLGAETIVGEHELYVAVTATPQLQPVA
jgi:hypothetical protein